MATTTPKVGRTRESGNGGNGNPEMKTILAVVLACGLAGCATRQATATCAYDAGRKTASGTFWQVEPSGTCSFTINAKLRTATDAETFSKAFYKMMGIIPKPEGIEKP